MRSILLSIKPKWWDLIAAGKKKTEARKILPREAPPYKVFFYVSAPVGKVMGEAICKEHCAVKIDGVGIIREELQACCLTESEIEDYSGGKDVGGMCLTDVKEYAEPREISEFFRVCNGISDRRMCWKCEIAVGKENDCGGNFELHLRRPPQSWCYVEEIFRAAKELRKGMG